MSPVKLLNLRFRKLSWVDLLSEDGIGPDNPQLPRPTSIKEDKFAKESASL